MSNEEENDMSDEEFKEIEEQLDEFTWRIDLETKRKHCGEHYQKMAKHDNIDSVRDRGIYYFEIFPDYLWKRVGRTLIDHSIKDMLRINVECVETEPRERKQSGI